jgi:hypothetical protein
VRPCQPLSRSDTTRELGLRTAALCSARMLSESLVATQNSVAFAYATNTVCPAAAACIPGAVHAFRRAECCGWRVHSADRSASG